MGHIFIQGAGLSERQIDAGCLGSGKARKRTPTIRVCGLNWLFYNGIGSKSARKVFRSPWFHVSAAAIMQSGGEHYGSWRNSGRTGGLL